jgi:molecular chaperone GrpE (heat shock protein)
MAEKKEATVRDFTDTVKEITGVVKESYLNGLELALSLWEENLRVLNSQLDKWLSLQQDYVKAGKEYYEKFPKEMVPFLNGNAKAVNEEVDRVMSFQKDYVDSVRSISDKFIKDTLSLTQKNVDRAFSIYDDFLNSFRV